MKKTIVVAGYGPGISQAVARKFGEQGLSVALVGRTAERLSAGAGALVEAGIEARPFVTDLGDPGAVRQLMRQVSGALGPIHVLHWNAMLGGQSDLLTAPVQGLRDGLELGVVSLIAGVQEALADLKQTQGSVLVTGGSLSAYDPQVDKRAIEWSVGGLAIAKAAQHKLVGLLHQQLLRDGVYVAEVTVNAIIKGSAFAQGRGTLEASAVADAFWKLHSERKDAGVTIS